MFFIQCTLVAIAIMMAVVICTVSASLNFYNASLQNQAVIYRVLYDFRHDLLGEYSDGRLFDIARDLKRVAELADDAKRGRIPNLRYADWYATEKDIERWEAAARNAAYL